jgi:hypothetical protein
MFVVCYNEEVVAQDASFGRPGQPTSFDFPHSILSLFLQDLSHGSSYVHALWAEVTRAWEADAVAEAARVTMVLAVETSTQEAAVARDSA